MSPVVTVEPRRRKFHKAITLSMPAPRAHSQGMINQYSGNAPTLRLLCSITGMYMKIYNVTQIIDNLIDNQLRKKKNYKKTYYEFCLDLIMFYVLKYIFFVFVLVGILK